jgi:hypothetical protein
LCLPSQGFEDIKLLSSEFPRFHSRVKSLFNSITVDEWIDSTNAIVNLEIPAFFGNGGVFSPSAVVQDLIPHCSPTNSWGVYLCIALEGKVPEAAKNLREVDIPLADGTAAIAYIGISYGMESSVFRRTQDHVQPRLRLSEPDKKFYLVIPTTSSITYSISYCLLSLWG